MIKLRPYQRNAIDAVHNYIARQPGHPLVVIPTAGGKSLVMASFIRETLERRPDQRILSVTHVRELIAQNHAELEGQWPGAPAGIFSAGLGRRDLAPPIVFAGIQSVYDKAEDIGHCDAVLIDEAHLIPRQSNSMYRRLLDNLAGINPNLRAVGLTASRPSCSSWTSSACSCRPPPTAGRARPTSSKSSTT